MQRVKPDEVLIETWRESTIAVILDLRAQYLANGASPLSHWDQLKTRVHACAKQSSGVREWCSLMLRKLQLEAPSVSLAYGIDALAALTDANEPAWLALVEKEVGFMIAMARVKADQRQQARAVRAVTESLQEDVDNA